MNFLRKKIQDYNILDVFKYTGVFIIGLTAGVYAAIVYSDNICDGFKKIKNKLTKKDDI